MDSNNANFAIQLRLDIFFIVIVTVNIFIVNLELGTMVHQVRRINSNYIVH